jgi:hypothetical protein
VGEVGETIFQLLRDQAIGSLKLSIENDYGVLSRTGFCAKHAGILQPEQPRPIAYPRKPARLAEELEYSLNAVSLNLSITPEGMMDVL